MSENKSEGVYVLLVQLTCKSGKRAEWLKEWDSLAKYVAAHEPNTLTYQASTSVDNADRLIIFERYTSKADLTEVHWKSKTFLEWKERMGKLDLVADSVATQYVETTVGHNDRHKAAGAGAGGGKGARDAGTQAGTVAVDAGTQSS